MKLTKIENLNKSKHHKSEGPEKESATLLEILEVHALLNRSLLASFIFDEFAGGRLGCNLAQRLSIGAALLILTINRVIGAHRRRRLLRLYLLGCLFVTLDLLKSPLLA